MTDTFRDYLFPRLDENAAFVFSVSFLSLTVIAPEVRAFVASSVKSIIFSGSIELGTVLILPILLFITFVVPLFLPFSRHDVAPFSSWIVLFDTLFVGCANLLWFSETGERIYLLLSAYLFLWFAVAKRRNPFFCGGKTSPKHALASAGVSIISIALLIYAFDIHWLKAYCIGTTAACFAYGISRTIAIETKFKFGSGA